MEPSTRLVLARGQAAAYVVIAASSPGIASLCTSPHLTCSGSAATVCWSRGRSPHYLRLAGPRSLETLGSGTWEDGLLRDTDDETCLVHTRP